MPLLYGAPVTWAAIRLWKSSRRSEQSQLPRLIEGRFRGVLQRSGQFGESATLGPWDRSEEHTSELQSLRHLVCRLLLEKKEKTNDSLTQKLALRSDTPGCAAGGVRYGAGARARGGDPGRATVSSLPLCFFFFNDTATTEIYTLSLHDALPISAIRRPGSGRSRRCTGRRRRCCHRSEEHTSELQSLRHLVCRLLLEKKTKH